MASRPPCRLSSPRRTARALLSTVALILVASATPSAVIVLVRRALADDPASDGLGKLAIALPLAALWLLFGVVVLGEVLRADRPVRRSSPAIAWLRRIVAGPVEASLLGTGRLAGWTSTRVDGSLADLEQPVAATRPARRPPRRLVRRSPVPPPPDHPAAAEPPPAWGPPAAPVSAPGRAVRSHHVRHGETWWSLAELYLGDGGRASELKQLNAGRAQADGSVVDHMRPLRAGWTIDIPPEEAAP